MATTWSPEDFIAPFGLFRPGMFPLEADLGVKIGKYLEEAEEKTAELEQVALDAAVECWVYYRGFLAAHVDYNAEPTKNTFADQGTEEYDQTQIDNWKKLSDEYLAKFNNLVAGLQGRFLNLPVTRGVKNQVDWL